jgi:hypothetical protein
MARFKIDKYGVLEMQRAEYLKTGMIVSQSPLSAEFTEAAPCENGMWVDANKANGEIRLVSDATKMYGIVYTTEKDYTGWRPALKHFRQVAGEYPRVGLLNVGDTFTTNTFNYEFTTETTAEQWQELKDAFAEGENPLYVIPTVGEGAPTVTATEPAEGPYAQVVKLYTVPAGTPGIKYVMVRV